MLVKEDFARLLAYNVWANHRLMRAAATVSADDFKRDFPGASHGGLRGTLTHIMSAEWIWLERWKGVSPGRLLDEGEFADVVALRDRWTLIESHRAQWFESLREDELRATTHYRNTEGVAYDAPLWMLVQHALNHSTYHRGQVSLLLRAAGARTVATDLVAWDRARAAAGSAAVD